jgi:CPA2 family monovalent cation:H+ antiporter-2
MAEIDLIIDLAVVMIVAGAVTVVFSKLKQPLILGYLIAGAIISPHTNLMVSVSDMTLIDSLASLGVIMLMFTLGLEFTLGRLREIGLFAIAVGTIEMILMIGIGFWTGILLGFPEGESLLLGSILSISSTAIVVKTMQDQGMLAKQHSQIVVGILVVEDVAAILMLAMITGFSGTGAPSIASSFQLLLTMVLFFVASIAIGYIFVPRIISRVARIMPTEVLLIVSLAFCFGLSVASYLIFNSESSLAIGAFIAGMLIGESEDVDLVVLRMTPIKEMFVAVFFVTMGMLFNFTLLPTVILPVILILVAFMVGKSLLVGTGALMFGFPIKTAFLAGTGMVALGEFSFIISRAGVDSGMAGEELYSIAIAIAMITAFLLPLSVKNGERTYSWLTKHAPISLKTTANALQGSLVSARSHSKQTPEASDEFHRRALFSLVDVALIAIIALFARAALGIRDSIAEYLGMQDTSFAGILIFICAVALLLPPVFSLSRNLEKIIETVVKQTPDHLENTSMRKGIRRALASVVAVVIGIALLLIAIPFALDRNAMSSLSPAIFLITISLIIILAWYLNKTLYRTFSKHLQRDIIKEHVAVVDSGKGPLAANSAETHPAKAADKEAMLLEGKEEL